MKEGRHSVVIVGGGPVGLCLALELDHHGVPVTIIEPRTVVDHTRPRAKTTSARTMEHLRRWGIAAELRAAAPLSPSWSQRVTFVRTVLGDEITHLDDCLGLSLPPQLGPEPSQQVAQGVVEEVLRASVAERSGIRALYGSTVTEVVQNDSHAVVTVVSETGHEQRLEASWVVGADGARSVVRRAMVVEYEGAAGGRPNVNITFRSTELAKRIEHPASIHYWVLDPEWPGVVGPLDHQGTWWAISTGTESVSDHDEARRIVHGLIGEEVDVEIIATDPWQARMLLASDYRDGRLFVVGDAAHQNPPWGGHGFNTGVGDAVNLGWKLAAVINGWAPEPLLDSYAAERRPVEAQTIGLAQSNMSAVSIDLSRELAADTQAPVSAETIERIREAKSPEFYANGLIFGYGYTPDAALQTPTLADYEPITAPGNRLPHELLGGESLFDLLGREFTIIGPAAAAAALIEAASAQRIPLTHVKREGQLVLVRPDQHIAWVGASVENAEQTLASALQGFLEASSYLPNNRLVV